MENENYIPGGVLSEFVDKVSFANYLPLLTRATAENDEPTAGYMFLDIEKITYEYQPQCQQLAEYLNRRLEKPSASVKLKVLKIMLHLVQNGHFSFRNYLRRNDGSIKLATMYSGPPDPLLGATKYETVRKTAQGLLDVLFDPSLIQQDDAVQTDERSKLQLGGLGSTGSASGKYEGFGSSPLDKEETIKDKMIDMLDKLMNPVDDTAEKIKSALSSSPGNYEAVAVQMSLPVQRVDKSHTSAERIRAHVPGRAGGGWESDDEVPEFQKSSPTNSGSTVSVDSLEKIDPAAIEANPAREIVTEFCSVQEWPVSLSQLNDTCKKCSSLNCVDVLEAAVHVLQHTSDISMMRALLMLEWFVRTDLVTPATFSHITLSPLKAAVKSDATSERVRMKAQKIQLVLEKLQPRQG